MSLIFNTHATSSASTNDRNDSEDHSKFEALAAFRTITLLLSKVQKQGLNTVDGDLGPKNSEERRALKILTALATVLVIHREVVAVVANQGPLPGTRQYRLLASKQSTEESPPPSPSSNWSFLKQFLISRNPRIDASTEREKPFFVKPEIPEPFTERSECNEEMLIAYVCERQ